MSEHRRVWNERYQAAGDEFVFGTAPSQFLVRKRGLLEGCRRVLCVADGEGRNSVWLAAQGFDVLATEISPVALAKARGLAERQGVSVDFVEADLVTWDWPRAAFDAVVAVFIQFTGPDKRAAMFAQIANALRPGGILLLHGYTPKQLEFRTGGPSALENLYTEGMLRDAFPELEILELGEYEISLDEGRGHAGLSAVIDFVGRRKP